MEKEFKKPELTPSERNRANGLWTLFSSRRGNFKKDEMCSYFGWTYPKHDRQIRDVISIVAKKFPIIGLSGDEGYRMARFYSDEDDVRHQLADLQSRINELETRKKPLENFLRAVAAQQNQMQDNLQRKA